MYKNKVIIQPSQTEFSTEENETLLSAALRQGYNLPHSCQGGVCGSCVAKLLSGKVKKHDEYDDYILTPEEKANNMILLCCSQAENNLENIENIIEIDMPSYAGKKALNIRTLPARIGDIELRGQVAIVRVDLPKAPPFQFYAGQYMEILLKDGTRSYSIANSPNLNKNNEFLKFHVCLRENGLFSPQLFNGNLTKGSIIRLRGPLGGFYLQENPENLSKPLILLSTGTGFAPIYGILQRLIDIAPNRIIHWYHGARYESHLYFKNELNQLFNNNQNNPTLLPNLHFTAVLSREENQDYQNNYNNYKNGHITDYIENLELNLDLKNCEVYACGLPEMVRDCRNLLISKYHLPENAYFSDAFTAHI